MICYLHLFGMGDISWFTPWEKIWFVLLINERTLHHAQYINVQFLLEIKFSKHLCINLHHALIVTLPRYPTRKNVNNSLDSNFENWKDPSLLQKNLFIRGRKCLVSWSNLHHKAERKRTQKATTTKKEIKNKQQQQQGESSSTQIFKNTF